MRRPLQLAAPLLVLAAGPVFAADPADEPVDPLRVGTHVVDVTPPEGYPMAGYYFARGADGTLDPLYAKAVVFRQGDETAAVVLLDLIAVPDDLTQTVRGRLSDGALMMDPDAVALAATHSHTAPSYEHRLRKQLRNVDGGDAYAGELVDAIVEAVESAAGDLKPVTLAVGRGDAEGVSFNRRFVLPDGSVKTWAKYARDPIVRPAGPAPTEVLTVAFTPVESDDADGEPVAALSTFALHLDTVGGSKWSADFPGSAARRLRGRFGADFAFLFGAAPSGDINDRNPRTSDKTPTELIGERLAGAVVAGIESAEADEPALAFARRTVDLPVREYTAADLDWAEQVIADDKGGNPGPMLDRVRAYQIQKLVMHREGADSENAKRLRAGGTSLRQDGAGDTIPVDVQVLRLGRETAVVFLPGEVFADLGLQIQRYSPFRNTLVVELANQNETKYVPTRPAFAGGGYEPISAVNEPGSGETLAEIAVEMLRGLRESK